MQTSDKRRLARRYPCEIDVELHLQQQRLSARTVDVSRHGLFVSMAEPPAENRVVFLTLMVPGEKLETMAVVTHRKLEPSRDERGAGFKFFAMSQEALQRWESFLASLGSGHSVLPQPQGEDRIGAAVATFFIQLDSAMDMFNFFERHVARGEIVRVTPPVRELGAEVTILFVHPTTQEEFSLKALVEELYADNPLRMGIRFPPLDPELRRAFLRFLGPSAVVGSDGSSGAMPLLAAARKGWTEYAFFSPKVTRTPVEPEVRTLVASDASLLSMEGADVDLSDLMATTAEPEDDFDIDVVMGDVLELPELEHVDPKMLFDFDWLKGNRENS
ncbi:MAG: PilZ domain-containing protein [Pseudomonadota bacterium]